MKLLCAFVILNIKSLIEILISKKGIYNGIINFLILIITCQNQIMNIVLAGYLLINIHMGCSLK
jgi:hypothetical protein